MEDDAEGPSRTKKAAVVVVPCFVLGIGNVVLILQWGLNPLWGVLLFPPVVFVSAIGWIAISGGIVDRGSEA
jgi:hypothetical protein